MMEQKIEKRKETEDWEELEKLFDKIENMKDFKAWFGTPCKNFNALCANCKFWNDWEQLKLKAFEVFYG